jgi:gliding motility-associated-like protein
MRHFIFLVAVFCLGNLFGQTTAEKFRLLLPTHDEVVKLQWADINSDSLLDAVIGYKIQNQFKVVAFQNGDVEPWPVHELVSTTAMDAISFQLIDFDKNGLLDVVIENDQQFLAHAYQNKGSFIFQASTGWGSREVFNRGLLYVDLNNDSRLDTIWSEGATLSIMNHKDTTLAKLESFLVMDFDNNGFRDIMFSGVNNDSEPVTICWYLGDNFQIINRNLVSDLVGELATGDINHDGLFDLVIAGKDASGVSKTLFFENKGQSFHTSSFGFSMATIGLDSAQYLVADFNSDGQADISFFGKTSNGQKVNKIETQLGAVMELGADVQHQAFGDLDRDGDLDWGQIKKDSLYVFENSTPVNKGPASPAKAIAIPIGDQIFFYWERPLDDHTSSNSLTYDLKVFDANATLVSTDFDSEHRHRTLVSHGNVGTNNFALLKVHGNYIFEIQSVDNAFVPNVKTVCKGSTAVCANVETQEIQACGDASVLLTPPAPQAMWFSLSKGFLGTADTYNYEAGESDIIFSFNPGNFTCANLKAYDIQVASGENISLSHIRYDCEGRNITMEAEHGWGNVQWKNNLNTTIVNAPSFAHAFEKAVIFTATASNNYGCTLTETFDLRVSKPNLQLNGTHFQIMRGNSVELVASGGSFYEWSPTGPLSNSKIANPVASPEETTEFTVTVLDSLGCSAQGEILVEVSEEAFVPTLFTPNGDNRNDQLKIYGLTQATGFQFVIFNREGTKIYETASIVEATQSGWTGVVNGVAQPPGTYYWKVEGRAPKGELLLNGKKEGTILLVR